MEVQPAVNFVLLIGITEGLWEKTDDMLRKVCLYSAVTLSIEGNMYHSPIAQGHRSAFTTCSALVKFHAVCFTETKLKSALEASSS